VRVLQAGQQVAFALETSRHRGRRIDAGVRQLQRATAEHPLRLLGRPHGGHAIRAQRLQQPVDTDLLTGHLRGSADAPSNSAETSGHSAGGKAGVVGDTGPAAGPSATLSAE
jgi:hypothetical protein